MAGRTGTGKTAILQDLNSAIDLEGHAVHRGSAFGGLAKQQPTVINFENNLASEYIFRIEDISDAESAMGTVYVDGVEIMGQGKQDKISAAANSIIEVARYSWLPIYSSATMFCMIASSYI